MQSDLSRSYLLCATTDQGAATGGTQSRRDPIAAEPPVDFCALAWNVHRAIRRLAPGRIRDLKVDVDGERVLLSGHCGTFYCKQTAQQAAMALATDKRVENQIVVDD